MDDRKYRLPTALPDHQIDIEKRSSKRPRNSHLNNEAKTLKAPAQDSSQLSSKLPLSKIEVLPAELLQQIVWLAHNPLVYIVSKTITSNLLPLIDYELDLALLLWCDRYHVSSAMRQANNCNYTGEPIGWGLVVDEDFPWQTWVARQHNLRLDQRKRWKYQRDVFDLDWLTETKFRTLAATLMEFWLKYAFKADNFEQYHSTGAKSDFPTFNHMLNFRVSHDWLLGPSIPSDMIKFSEQYRQQTGLDGMKINRGCQVKVFFASENLSPCRTSTENDGLSHILMDTLYIPPQLFDPARCSKDNLFPLLRHCQAVDLDQLWLGARTSFSIEHAIQGLRTSIKEVDRLAFARIFGLLLNQIANDQAHNLDEEVGYTIWDRRTLCFTFGFSEEEHPFNGIIIRDDAPYTHQSLTRNSKEFVDQLMAVLTRSDDFRRCAGLQAITRSNKQMMPPEGFELCSWNPVRPFLSSPFNDFVIGSHMYAITHDE